MGNMLCDVMWSLPEEAKRARASPPPVRAADSTGGAHSAVPPASIAVARPPALQPGCTPLRSSLASIIREIFTALDTNGDGVLTRAEFFGHLQADGAARLGQILGVERAAAVTPTQATRGELDLAYVLAVFARAAGAEDADDAASSFTADELCSFVAGDASARARLNAMVAAERDRSQRLSDARFERRCKRAGVPAMLTTAQRVRVLGVFEAIDADGDTLVSFRELRRIVPPGAAHATLLLADRSVEAVVGITRVEVAQSDADDVSGACAAVGMNFLSAIEFTAMLNAEAAAESEAVPPSAERTETIVEAWEHGVAALALQREGAARHGAAAAAADSPFVGDRGW